MSRATLRLLAAVLALLAPAAALAASRTFTFGSFDRVRVDGPLDVRITTGRSPGARVEGAQELVDAIEVTVEGDTLVARYGVRGQPSGRSDAPPVVTLSTPGLRSAAINSGAKLSVTRMAGQRIDVAVNGAGALSVAAVEADQLQAVVIGAGSMTLAGHAARARLLTNGPGAIDASGLATSDLTVRLDGPGETKASARYTAQVTNTGLGKVTVIGNAKCVVKAQAGGPVLCGPKL